MTSKFYYLASLRVVFLLKEHELSKEFNVLMPNDDDFVTRRHLGQCQQQAQIRFKQQFDPENRAEVVDVLVTSVSRLGEMTEEQFHDGMETDVKGEEPKPKEKPKAANEQAPQTTAFDLTGDDTEEQS